MRPEVQNALNLLAQSTGLLQLSREDHNKILNAIRLITDELSKKEVKEKKK